MAETKKKKKVQKKKVVRTQSTAKSQRSKEAKPDWDLVVIGTGMGGSAAGAIGALRGLKTLVLEKNPRPGGSCSYYLKRGFHVDTGTHLFIRGNKGPFGALTRQLGMGTPLEFIQTPMISHLRGMNLNVTVPQAWSGRAAVLPLVLWQIKINPIHYPSILHLVWDILTMNEQQIEALDKVSIEEFMLKYTDNAEIRSMIGLLLGLFFILPPWEASAGESIWNLQKLIMEDNLSYPKGGAAAIPKAFLQGAEQHGAKIKLKAGVKKIEVAHNRVKAVVLDNGQRITTRAVISTTSLEDTVLRLAGSRHFPEQYLTRVRAITPAWTAVQAKIGLKKKLLTAGSLVGATPLKFDGKITDEITRDAINKLENGILGDMIPIYAPVPSNYDPGLAPEGCQLITAVAVAPTLNVKVDDESIWIDGMMDALSELIPGLKENIIFCDTWSVKTLADWIGKSNGSAITTSQTPSQVTDSRPGHQTPVKGLYIAGDCGGSARGVGTELACQSGMDCGNLVAHDLSL